MIDADKTCALAGIVEALESATNSVATRSVVLAWTSSPHFGPMARHATVVLEGPKARNRWGVFRGGALLCSRRRRANAVRVAKGCGGRVVECNGRDRVITARLSSVVPGTNGSLDTTWEVIDER